MKQFKLNINTVFKREIPDKLYFAINAPITGDNYINVIFIIYSVVRAYILDFIID